MAEEKRTRVTVFVNGDYSTRGKLLLITPDVQSLNDLFAKAATKLPAQEQAFTRLFVASGAEVSSLEEIESGDFLVFSSGAEFVQPPSFQTEAEDVERNHFLQKMANIAFNQASTLYGKSTTYVKENSPASVKNTFEKVQGTVEKVANPVLNKVATYGAPVISWADSKIDVAYDTVRQSSIQLLQSDLAQNVNALLKERLLQPSEYFYRTLVEAWVNLHGADGKTKATVEQFISLMKERLGAQWNDRLVEPAKNFYASVESEYPDLLRQQEGQSRLGSVFANVKQKLGARWDTDVVASLQLKQQVIYDNFQHQIREPAEAFVKSAVESYNTLVATGNGKVKFDEFIAGLRVKLGLLWNDNLLPPAQAVFDRLSTLPLVSQAFNSPYFASYTSSSSSSSSQSGQQTDDPLALSSNEAASAESAPATAGLS